MKCAFRIRGILAMIMTFAAVAFSQSTFEIRGRVTDANGHAITGASVLLERTDIRFSRETTTADDGSYSFSDLGPGRYDLKVVASGFTKGNSQINVPSPQSVDIELRPGQIAVDVSVTASYIAGTPESLSEIPGSVERLDYQLITNSRALNVSEILRKVSGVNVREEEGFGLRPNIGIRGTNPTRSSKILLLEDGMPLAYAPYGDNASYYHPPIERYDSVEVLKGSGQIAYGPHTVGGVINYITPIPSEKPSFALKLIGGNRSFFNGSFTGAGTVGKTGIFAGFTRKQGDGARDFVNSRLNDLSTKIVQTLNGEHALTFKFSYYGEDSNVTYSGLTEAEYLADQRGNAFKNDFFYGDRFGFSASHAAVLSPKAVVTTNFYANNFKRHWWRQSSNSSQRPNRLNVDPDCRSMADLSTTCGNEGRLRQYQTYGIEPRVVFNYDAGSDFRGELQGGLRIHWEKQDRRQENGDLPDSRSGALAELNVRKNQAFSGYVQNRFIFGDVSITPGVRFEKISVARINSLVAPAASGNTSVDVVIPGIGVSYSGLPRTTVFAGVHRGFSPPRAEDVVSNSGGVVELDPELSWNYEVGMRSNPVDGLRLEGTFFRLDYENQIVPASLAGGVGAVLTNGGATLQQGVEFSAQVDAGTIFNSRHNFYLRTAYTWLPIAEFRGTRMSSITPTVSVTGNRLPYAPETLLTSSIGYSHPKGFDAFVENVYVGSQFSDDLNTLAPIANGQRGAIDAQNYWNATVNYTVESWRTTFFVTAKNLLDRTYIIDRSRGILPSGPRLIQTGVNIRF